MKIYYILVTVFVCFCCNVSSHASKKCDITFWHMTLMEHILTMETEMTQQQKSILVKIEQIIERVTKDGAPPLVNCAVLNTYSYNLIPDASSQLMNLVVQESDKNRNAEVLSMKALPTFNAEAVRSEVRESNVRAESKNEDSTNFKKFASTNDDSKNNIDKFRKDNVENKGYKTKEEDISNIRGKQTYDDMKDKEVRNDGRRHADEDGDHADSSGVREKSNGVGIRDTNEIYYQDVDNGEDDKGGGDIKKDSDDSDIKHDRDSSDTKSDINSSDIKNYKNGDHTTNDKDHHDISNDRDDRDIQSVTDVHDTKMDRDVHDTKMDRNTHNGDNYKGEQRYDENVDDDVDSDPENDNGDDCYYHSAGEFVCERDVRSRESHSRKDRDVFSGKYSRDVNDGTGSRDESDENTDRGDTNSRDASDNKTDRGDKNGRHVLDDADSRDEPDEKSDPDNKNKHGIHNNNTGRGGKNNRDVLDDITGRGGKNSRDVLDDITDRGGKNSLDAHGTNSRISLANSDSSNTFDDKDSHDGADDKDSHDGPDDKDSHEGPGVPTEQSVKYEELDTDDSYENHRQLKPPEDKKKKDKLTDDDRSSDIDRSTMPLNDNDDNSVFDRETIDDGSGNDHDDRTNRHNNNKINSKRNDDSGGVVIFYDDDEEGDDSDDEGKTDQTQNGNAGTSEERDTRKQSENIDDIDTHGLAVPDDDNINNKDRDNNKKKDNTARGDKANEGDLEQELHSSERMNALKVGSKRFHGDEQTREDNEVLNRDEKTLYSINYDKLSMHNNEGNDFDINKYNNMVNKNMNKEMKDTPNIKQSLRLQNAPDLSKNRDQSNLELEKMNLMFTQRESEQAAKIQNLELMLVKLENKILAQSINKQSDSTAFVNLENQILKLENELMKLSQNYRKLQEDHDAVKAQQKSSYLELEHLKTTPQKSKYPALTDNSSNEIMIQQQTRIWELSKLVQNQSALAQKLQNRSEFLENENQKLFHAMMNQTALIESIMSKLNELGKDGLKTRAQAEEFNVKLEKMRQKQALNDPLMQEDTNKQPTVQNQAGNVLDFAIDSSVKSISPVASKDLVSIILRSMTRSPTAESPASKTIKTWRCDGLNSTRLCLLQTVIIANCTPFNTIQWRQCTRIPGSSFLDTKSENENILKNLSNYSVKLPEEEQTLSAKYHESQARDRLKNYSHLEGGSLDGTTETRNSDFKNKEMQFVVSVTEDKHKQETLDIFDSSTDGGNVEIKHEKKRGFGTDELTAFLPKSGNKETIQLNDEDQGGARRSNSLNDYSELIQNGVNIYNSDKTGNEDNVIKVDNSEQSEGGKSNSIVLETKDREKSPKASKMEDNNIPKSENKLDVASSHAILPGTAQMTASTNVTVSRALCEPNNDTPECRNQIQAAKIPVGVSTAGLNANDESRDRHNDESQHQLRSDHSTTDKGGVNKAQEKVLSDRDIKERRKAAAEAMKMHEALHRKVLYSQMHKDRSKDCYELYKRGQERNGMNQIYVSGMNVYVSVYCDMTNGGWTILLKREDGLVDFYRDYDQYTEGFGAPRGEHYVGNEVIHHLTNQGHYSLKAELTDWDGTLKRAFYDHFWVDGEDEGFRLHLLGYSGDAGDGLSKHNAMKFSTFDADNDLLKAEMGGSCAKRFHGAGWYYNCYSSNLFGRYYAEGEIPGKLFDGVAWKPWRGPGHSLKTAILAVRPFGVET